MSPFNRKSWGVQPTLPYIPKDLITWLVEEFKPHCYDGTGGLEAHLVFAGKVELVAWLREEHLRQDDAAKAINALGDTVLQFDPAPSDPADEETAHVTVARDLLQS